MFFFYNVHVPVICIPGPPRAGDNGDRVGLKCQDLTSDESWQCQGCVGVLIYHHYTQLYLFKILIVFLTFNYFYSPCLIYKCNCTFTYRNSSPSLIIHFHQNNPQMLFHIIMSASGELGLSVWILPQICPRSAGLLAGL